MRPVVRPRLLTCLVMMAIRVVFGLLAAIFPDGSVFRVAGGGIAGLVGVFVLPLWLLFALGELLAPMGGHPKHLDDVPRRSQVRRTRPSGDAPTVEVRGVQIVRPGASETHVRRRA